MESFIVGIELALGVYLAIGALLLLPFHRRVVPRIDHQADGASWGFRVAVSPGLIALWPILLHKWNLARKNIDPHGSPERPVSSLGVRRLQSSLVKLVAITLPLLLAAALYFRPAPPAKSDLHPHGPETTANGR